MKFDRKNLFLILAVLALAGSVVGPAIGQDSVDPVSQPPVLSVHGTGNVSLDPDMVTVEIGVTKTAVSAKDAINQNTEIVQAVKEALLNVGIDNNDITTSSYNLYTTYPPESGTDEENPVQFTVSYIFKIVVRDLEHLNEVLDTCFDSGANTLYGMNFNSSSLAEGLIEARDLAIDAAKQEAEQIAAKLGKTVGNVKAFSVRDYALEGNASSYAVKMTESAPVQSGYQTISVTVDMDFILQ